MRTHVASVPVTVTVPPCQRLHLYRIGYMSPKRWKPKDRRKTKQGCMLVFVTKAEYKDTSRVTQ